jgi:hypothetical protein
MCLQFFLGVSLKVQNDAVVIRFVYETIIRGELLAALSLRQLNHSCIGTLHQLLVLKS